MIEKDFDVNNINTVVLNMVKNNKISNILEYKIIGNNIYYDIDGKISLNEMLGNQISPNNFIKILDSIAKTLINLESYMITFQNINLNIESIYKNQMGELYLEVNPSKVYDNDIKTFYQELYLNKIIETDKESINLIKINNYFNSTDYSLSGLRKLIQNLQKEEIEELTFPKENNKKTNNKNQENNRVDTNIRFKKNSIFRRLFNSKDNNIINQKNI